MDGARGMNAIHEDPAYRALLAHSARIGADPALVQGAGGNTSLKRDGVLWVKASGTWLRDAERRAIMAEEHQPMTSPEDHAEAVAGLMRAASPLAGLPGARACRICGRGIWCASGWRGLPRDVCWQCAREETP